MKDRNTIITLSGMAHFNGNGRIESFRERLKSGYSKAVEIASLKKEYCDSKEQFKNGGDYA